MRTVSEEPVDAEFTVVSNPENLPALKKREPFFVPRTQPIIKSWENLAVFLFLIVCVVVGRLIIYPLVGRIIHPLFAR